MEKYVHNVKYYETDRMGITHHSNYIRWMEEARVDFMAQLGWSYQRFEEEGIVSPVTAIECKFRRSTTFADNVYITVAVKEYHGVRLKLKYTMTDEKNKVVFEATSEHCFMGKDGKLIRMDKTFPEFYQLLCDLAAKAD